MAKTAQEAFDEIIAHINKEGGLRNTWYSGITSDIEARLHGDHGVPKKDHWFIYRETISSSAARAVEKALIDSGTDGGSGGGDDNAAFVYAYKKTSITDP